LLKNVETFDFAQVFLRFCPNFWQVKTFALHPQLLHHCFLESVHIIIIIIHDAWSIVIRAILSGARKLSFSRQIPKYNQGCKSGKDKNVVIAQFSGLATYSPVKTPQHPSKQNLLTIQKIL